MVDVKLGMYESIAHPNNPLPRYLWQTPPPEFSNLSRRLADNPDIFDQRKDQLTIVVQTASSRQ